MARLPFDLVERVAARDREVAADGQARLLVGNVVHELLGRDLHLLLHLHHRSLSLDSTHLPGLCLAAPSVLPPQRTRQPRTGTGRSRRNYRRAVLEMPHKWLDQRISASRHGTRRALDAARCEPEGVRSRRGRAGGTGRRHRPRPARSPARRARAADGHAAAVVRSSCRAAVVVVGLFGLFLSAIARCSARRMSSSALE